MGAVVADQLPAVFTDRALDLLIDAAEVVAERVFLAGEEGNEALRFDGGRGGNAGELAEGGVEVGGVGESLDALAGGGFGS